MNSIQLIGRLTAKPEIRYTPSNKAVCEFNLAVNRFGEGTDFITCQVWNNQAENLAKYQDKGSLIGVSGSYRVDKYENQEKQTRYKHYILANNVEYLSSAKSGQDAEKPQESPVTTVQDDPYTNFGNSVTVEQIDQMTITDEDLPF